MKKFKLTIAQPCHEEWNNMTPEQQGRFCAACQKTVVDFTAMSDRQVLDYFKKPAGSLCGRFHNDQLNRPFVAPKKRLPWVRYFFQFTWPAFVLFLKSCGQKDEQTNTMGEPLVLNQERVPAPPVTMGAPLPTIMPVDTIKQMTIEPLTTVGDVSIVSETDSDSYAIQKPTAPIDSLKQKTNDESDSTANEAWQIPKTELYNDIDTGRSIIAGMVSVCTKHDKTNTTIQAETTPRLESTKNEFMIYPNPVNNGHTLTASIGQKMSGYYQVLSTSGQVMRFGRLKGEEGQTFTIEVGPWPAGNYFIQLMDESTGKSITQKFMVQ